MSKTATLLSTPPVRRSLLRKLWRLTRWMLTLLILFAGVFLCIRWYRMNEAEKKLAAAVAETDAVDPQWRFDDIFINRPPLADEKNGALVILEMKKRLPEKWPPKHNIERFDAILNQPRLEETDVLKLLEAHQTPERLNAETLKILREDLASATTALSKARKLQGYRDGRFPIELNRENPFATLLPDIQDTRNAAFLLRLDVEESCELVDAQRAFNGIVAALNAGRVLGDEPVLIVLLTRIADQMIAIRTLERAMALVELTETQLESLQLELARQFNWELLVSALRGDRIAAFLMFKGMIEGRIGYDELIGQRPGKRGYWERCWHWAWNKANLIEAQANYLRRMNQIIEKINLPRPDRVIFWRNVEADIGKRKDLPNPGSMDLLFVPAIQKVDDVCTRWQAELDCARTAIAVERYRREHKQWPDSLKQLCPKYLPEIPRDPFGPTGEEPLLYRQFDDGVVIYSLGYDGEDNHGHKEKENLARRGNDIPIRLYNPDKRRQPPPPIDRN